MKTCRYILARPLHFSAFPERFRNILLVPSDSRFKPESKQSWPSVPAQTTQSIRRRPPQQTAAAKAAAARFHGLSIDLICCVKVGLSGAGSQRCFWAWGGGAVGPGPTTSRSWGDLVIRTTRRTLRTDSWNSSGIDYKMDPRSGGTCLVVADPGI